MRTELLGHICLNVPEHQQLPQKIEKGLIRIPAPDAASLITALNHPLRRRILRTLGGPTVTASATDLAENFGLRLGNVAYHVRVLAELRALTLVRTERVRGATERFYRFAPQGQREWVRVVLKETETGDCHQVRVSPEMTGS